MTKKHKQRSFVPAQYAALKISKTKSYINTNALVLNAWKQIGDAANIFVSLRYVQHSWQCFSEWSKIEMTEFWGFLRKIHEYTWAMLFSQSGKGGKTGMGYTQVAIEKYPQSSFRDNLDPNITLFELRISEKSRVHCFRHESVCYICWLDRNHDILR